MPCRTPGHDPPAAGRHGRHDHRDSAFTLKEFQRLKKELNDILLRHTGQTLERIEKDTDRDKFMSPREAVEYGIIDKVLERVPHHIVREAPGQ